MFEFIKKRRLLKKNMLKVEQIKAKAELLKQKNILRAAKAKKNTAEVNQITKHIASVEQLKDIVAETIKEENPWLKFLDHPVVSNVVNHLLTKGKSIENLEKKEIIEIVDKLPPDVLKKGLKFLQDNWQVMKDG